MSENLKNNPNRHPTLTRRGRIAAGAGAVIFTLGSAAGINALANSGDDNPTRPDKTHDIPEEGPDFFATHDTKNVKVRPGDGVDQVVQRAYGIEAPEGTNQVVQNNPAYAEQYQAVVDANNGSDELSPGKLPVPEDFLTQEEIDRMQVNQQ